ncbi:MAG: thioredoxin domain-containing protein [Thermoguttaceae bacterium]
MSNRLANALSPYLLQHARNPVDWYPWGEEARRKAREEDKPLFLSIGYSSCHWCHVMAHESFENEGIARLLAAHFVSVKVDREERPDLDQLYMDAVQAMTGQGGWPLSVFLAPDGRPFFGGTYWPYPARAGMPGFDQVLGAIARAWQERRQELLDQADKIVQFLEEAGRGAEEPGREAAALGPEPLDAVAGALQQAFDAEFGGFGQAPKFPQPTTLRFLLRRWRRSGDDDLLRMAVTTLQRMADGGIYDHLGGGFHRYSVDRRWLVPHFEKMLYDNAQLVPCYLEAWQATGQKAFAQVARETLDYVLRDMTHAEGAFFSSEDADSEGREGTFYLWTPAEVAKVLGADRAATFCRVYDVTESGNFEGKSILNRPRPLEEHAGELDRPADELAAELAESRATLLASRAKRVRPGRDDKVLLAWNAMTVDALARAGAALDEPRYVEAAVRAAEFLLGRLRDDRGRLLHCWRNGEARHPAFLDDLTLLAGALASLYETTGARRWLDTATVVADDLLVRFADPAAPGFFYTPHDHEPLVARKKEFLDGSTPSGNGLAASVLLRLDRLRGRTDYTDAAVSALRAGANVLDRMPTAAGQLLLALEAYLDREL